MESSRIAVRLVDKYNLNDMYFVMTVKHITKSTFTDHEFLSS